MNQGRYGMPVRSGGGVREIASVITSGTQATVLMSGIPQCYRDLLLVINARSTAALTSTQGLLVFNGDTGANYVWNRENRFGVSGSLTATAMQQFSVPAASTGAFYPSITELRISDYTDSSRHRAVQGFTGLLDNATPLIDRWNGWWVNRAEPLMNLALSLVSGSFLDGSTATLYGVGGSGE